ncbi:MAG: SAM-dependent methyltransferase [Catenulispora sp.]|nr:SAM-dependent methyltransferase [Catenulispora sp.]
MTAQQAGPSDADLRAQLVRQLTDDGVLDDAAWAAAVGAVPRHRFVPGFYIAAPEADTDGLTVWEPVTEATDPQRWLAEAYTDTTLITQFDGDEPDWQHPAARHGGAPTSSATLPSLVVRMWADAQIDEDMQVLEIGTGTGYSTALACERLGSKHVTSIEVDPNRLNSAAAALFDLGYHPTLAVADGLFGYRPAAPFDRIVAACSTRGIPTPWLAQTAPGGKILTTLSGWLFGYARVLLTVHEDGTASGPLLPGTVSFMAARTQAPPAFGNPTHWTALNNDSPRPAQHSPERITAAGDEAFFARFLVQSAIPDAQLTWTDQTVVLIDVHSGSVAQINGDQVRQAGPIRLWDRAETILDAFDAAGRPGPETFSISIDDTGQHLLHTRMPTLPLTGSTAP